MLQRRKKTPVIPAEKMALLAEKGLNAVRLSRAEMISLADGGLNELYAIKKGINSPTPLPDPRLIDKVMAVYSPATSSDTPAPCLKGISVRLTKKMLAVVAKPFDWQLSSPAFAQRSSDSSSVSLQKEAGTFTVHLELTKSGERQAGINVLLTRKSKRERPPFEATLFQDNRPVESVHVAENPVASFSNINTGDYQLKISDGKREIASVDIRFEA